LIYLYKMKKITVVMLLLTVVMFFPGGLSVAEIIDPSESSDFAEDTDQDSKGLITLELKGMDILEVLKILARKSGLNIAAGKNVRGKVTVFLKNIEPWNALEIILETNDLAYEMNGNVIKVVTAKDYEARYGQRFSDKTGVEIVKLQHARAEDVSSSLEQIKSKVGNIIIDARSNLIILKDTPAKIEEMKKLAEELDEESVTRIFQLNYAKAEDLQGRIEDLLSQNIGKIKVDERTNKIIVTDVSKKINEIERVITAFDEKPQAVLIETEIIEIRLTDEDKFGIDWEGVFDAFSLLSTGPLPRIDIDMRISGYTTVVGLGQGDMKGILQFLKEETKSNILSSPKIAVLNNEEARILVGTRDVYITATISQVDNSVTSAPAVNFIDLGVTLDVTPTINRDGYITMKIKPQVSSFERYETLKDAEGREIAKVPVVKTTEAETTIIVKDGETMMIAGLIEDRETKTRNKTPVLSRIPLLGNLFTARDDEIEKTELVIFLTPHIIVDKEEDFSVEVFSEEEFSEKDFSEIDTQPFSRGHYYRMVKSKINERLRNNRRQKKFKGIKGEANVYFIVRADGTLKGDPQVTITKETPESFFLNVLAIRSVKEAFPVAPFPEGVTKKEQAFGMPIVLN